MEQRDVELIQKHMGEDSTLKSLYDEHVDFEQQLEKFNNKPFLTPQEEMERKNLQKLKLKGKDKLEMILEHYRKIETAS